jgi:hypothetical protein
LPLSGTLYRRWPRKTRQLLRARRSSSEKQSLASRKTTMMSHSLALGLSRQKHPQKNRETRILEAQRETTLTSRSVRGSQESKCQADPRRAYRSGGWCYPENSSGDRLLARGPRYAFQRTRPPGRNTLIRRLTRFIKLLMKPARGLLRGEVTRICWL